MAQKLNMTISLKTKCSIYAKKPIRCKLAIQGKSHRSGNVIQISTNQTNKVAGISGCLRDVMWKNEHLRADS